MNSFLRLFVPVALVSSAIAGAPLRAGESTGLLFLAQNTVTEEIAPADTASAPPGAPLTMPPMPPARIQIRTEKPVPALPLRTSTPPDAVQPSSATPQETGLPATASEPSLSPDGIPATLPGTTAPVMPDTITDMAGTEMNQQELADSGLDDEPPSTFDPAEIAAGVTIPQPQIDSGIPGVIDAAASAAGAAAATGESVTGTGESPARTDQQAQPVQTQPPAAQQEMAVLPPQTAPSAPVRSQSQVVMQEMSIFNVPTANLRTMKVVIDEEYNLRGMVYGEEQGYLRKLDADANGNFREVWKSPPLNSPVREVFVDDIDGDGGSEIVAYTANGNIFIYRYNTHELVYRTPEGTYDNIRCMIIANLDNDPQKELLFIATKPGTLQQNRDAGNLIQFDTVSQFEEWTSSDLYSATDMVIGNVDNDDEMEIILNTGEILSQRFKTIKWKSDIDFGSRLYLIDLDNDGILELVTAYNQSYVRIFDIDRRQEKW